MGWENLAIGVGAGLNQAIDSGSKLYAIKNMQDQMALRTEQAGREAQLFKPQLEAANAAAALNTTQSALAEINLGKAKEQEKLDAVPVTVPDLFSRYAPNIDPNSPTGQHLLRIVTPLLEKSDVTNDQFLRSGRVPEMLKLFSVPAVADEVAKIDIKTKDAKLSELDNAIAELKAKSAGGAPDKKLQALQAERNQLGIQRAANFAKLQGMSDQLKTMQQEYGVGLTDKFFNGEVTYDQMVSEKERLKQMDVDKAARVAGMVAGNKSEAVAEKKTLADEKRAAAAIEKTLAQARANIAYNQKERKIAEAKLAKEEDPGRKLGWEKAIEGFNEAIDENNLFIANGGRVASAPTVKGTTKGNGKTLDRATAEKYKAAAGGDRAKAEKMAKDDGWVF